MEKTQFETLITPPESSIRFNRQRKSHLNSETYRTLSRILNRCYDYSQCSLSTTTPIVEDKSRTDDNLTTKLEEQVSDEVEKLSGEEACNEVGTLSGDKAPKKLGAEVRNELQRCDGGGTDDTVADGIDRINDDLGGIENIICIDEMNEIDTEDGGKCNYMVVDEITKLISREDNMKCNVIVAIGGCELNNGGARIELNDKGIDDSRGMKVIDNEHRDVNRVQTVTSEFECVMRAEGNEKLVTDNCNNLSILPVDNNEARHKTVKLIDVNGNYLIEESGGSEKLLLGNEGHGTMFKNAESSFDKILEVRNNVKEKLFNLKTDEPKHHELPQKVTELEKSIFSSNEMVSSTLMDVNQDIEEGEVSDDLGLCDLFVDIVPADEKNVCREQNLEVVIKEMVVTAAGNETDALRDILSNVHNLDISDDVDHKKNDIERSNKIIANNKWAEAEKEDGYHCMPEGRHSDRLLYNDDFLENTNNGEFASTQKNVEACKTKKRAGSSQKKKEKAKKRKRIKRAERDRKNGVKRLKLPPVEKTKVLKPCDHYQKGRCRKGAECTFSHDGEPATKSTPCCHQARGTCMKGDKCPYDHDLSKHPCKNIETTGSCIRGDTCKFSHKMPVNEPPTTLNICIPESTTLQPGSSDSKKQQTSYVPNKNTGVYPMNSLKQVVAGTSLRPPAQPPKGMNFLSFRNSPLNHLSQTKQSGSLSNGNNIQLGNQMNPTPFSAVQSLNEVQGKIPPALAPNGNNIQLGNQMNPTPFSAVQSLNEVQGKIPPALAPNGNNIQLGNQMNPTPLNVGPNGINPFSVGTVLSSDDSIRKKHAVLPSNSESDISVLPLNTSSTMKLVSSSPPSNGFRPHESQTMYDMQKKEASVLISPGMNPFSLGNITLVQHTSLPFKENADIKIPLTQNSSTMAAMPPVSSLPPRILNRLSDRFKTSPGPAQKSLLSTLAFAAKYELKMKMR